MSQNECLSDVFVGKGEGSHDLGCFVKTSHVGIRDALVPDSSMIISFVRSFEKTS